MIFLSHLRLDINIPLLTATGHGYRKPIDLSEQLPSYALLQCDYLPEQELVKWTLAGMECEHQSDNSSFRLSLNFALNCLQYSTFYFHGLNKAQGNSTDCPFTYETCTMLDSFHLLLIITMRQIL